MFATVLADGEEVDFPISGGRYAWVQCVTGAAEVNGLAIKAGDGVAVSDEPRVVLRGTSPSGGELLLFDLP
jgi:redox-sensitive bicupin YhaK (pirin superfamily)